MSVIFKIADKWLPELVKKLDKSFKQRRDIREDIYNEINIDLDKLAAIYIEPNCQPYNPADERSEASFMSYLTGAFALLENFINQKSLPENDGRNQLFVLADAGMGKSSLLAMLYSTYMTGFWPSGYNCVLMKIDSSTIERILTIDKPRTKILLLDALDEDIESFGSISARLNQLLIASSKFMKVIITCRTQFFPLDNQDLAIQNGKIRLGSFRCPITYLSLFNDTQINKYLNKIFPGKPNTHTRKKARDVLFSIGRLRMRPMLLAHIEDLLSESRRYKNIFDLYQTLVLRWIDREILKQCIKWGTEKPDRNILFNCCMVLAINMHKSGRDQIDLSKLEKFLKAFKPFEHFQHFQIGGRSLLNKNSEGSFRFAHKSIQEFLIVSCLNKHRYLWDRFEPSDLMKDFLKCIDLRGLKIRQGYWGPFEGSDLDLESSSFLNVNFANSKFTRVNFSNCDLEGSIFSNSTFESCNLKKSNLTNTMLNECTFIDCNFEEANLVNANLENSNLIKANLNYANLRQTKINMFTRIDEKWSFISTLLTVGGKKLDLKNRDLSYSRLHDLDLSNVDLSGTNLLKADLSGSSLRETIIDTNTQLDTKWETVWKLINQKALSKHLFQLDFSNVNLENVNLDGVKLDGIDLSNANLSSSKLRNASLIGANLEKANLDSVDLSHSDLSGANLKDTNLVKARLFKTNIGDTCFLSEEYKIIWNLYNNHHNTTPAPLFTQSNFEGYDLSGLDLSGADFRGSSFKDTNLENSNLMNCLLDHVNFVNAKLNTNTQISHKWRRVWEVINDIDRVAFDNGGDFCNAYLCYVNFSSSEFVNTNFRGSLLRGANFSRSSLVGIDFSSANLQNVNLNEAKVRNAILIGSNLSEANLTDADIEGALIENANLSGAVLKRLKNWQSISSYRDVNIHEVKDASEEFIETAKQRGATQKSSNKKESNLEAFIGRDFLNS